MVHCISNKRAALFTVFGENFMNLPLTNGLLQKFRNVRGEHLEGGNVLLIKHPLRVVHRIENMMDADIACAGKLLEWALQIGEVSAVNRELEVRFGNHVNGLKLVERGPEIEAVVDVFETWIKKYPGDVILEKWLPTSPHETEPPPHDHWHDTQVKLVLSGSTMHCSPPVNKVKASKKKKKAMVVKSNTSVMHLYRDAEPIPVKGRGGAKVMDLVSVNTYLKSNPEK
ncbi:hypothetical protein M405DRAFT_869382 [Rhizopogon salebrosus TDB-379]|nr:hypothetical protein M405DRAFT_869382 [Rhizopogon salebrosus TDB-379]